MSNISIRKNGETPAASTPAEVSSEPWRTMRALLSWNPFHDMTLLPLGSPGAAHPFGRRDVEMSPAFEVKETKDAYLFRADVPGIDERDLEVTITGRRLAVAGKREEEHEEKADRYYTYERDYGSFTRAFNLPEGADVDGLRASLEHGVLTVTVPKKPEVQPKKIAVTSEGQGQGGMRH
ncbi:MAG: Hsp20/alpha crystallin family protein [Polyangiaceae bacterium]